MLKTIGIIILSVLLSISLSVAASLYIVQKYISTHRGSTPLTAVQQESGNKNLPSEPVFSSTNTNSAPLDSQAKKNTSINPQTNPQFDEVHVSTASSFASLTDTTQAVLENASVPDGVQLTQDSSAGKKGDILIYFPNFQDPSAGGHEQIGMVRSSDGGATWSDRQDIAIDKKPTAGGMVDPSVIELPDGRLRIYFFGSEIVDGDPASASSAHNFYSAVSTDGINFTLEDGVRFSANGITDPEVIYFNGQYIMYISRGPLTLIATSTDGLTFTDTGLSWQGGGVPGAVVEGGVVRLFGCSSQGMVSATSSDGKTFGSASSVFSTITQDPVIECDPSPMSLLNGQFMLIYKKHLQQ